MSNELSLNVVSPPLTFSLQKNSCRFVPAAIIPGLPHQVIYALTPSTPGHTHVHFFYLSKPNWDVQLYVFFTSFEMKALWRR